MRPARGYQSKADDRDEVGVDQGFVAVLLSFAMLLAAALWQFHSPVTR